MKKTNAMRLLDKNKIPYTVLTYEHDENNIDGISVADKINRPYASVYKTIVLKGKENHYVALLPVDKHLDLKAVAKVFNERKVEMLPVKDLFNVTGYVRGACSPLAMRKLFQMVVDESFFDQTFLVISSGVFGQQLEIHAKDFQKSSNKPIISPIVQ